MLKWSRTKTFVLISLATAIVSGISFYLLSDSPFGKLFWGTGYVCIVGICIAIFFADLQLFQSAKVWKKAAGTLIGLIALAIFSFATIIIIDYRLVLFRDISGSVSKSQWQEDLQFLAKELPKRHPDFYSAIYPDVFREKVATLERNISTLSDHQIIAEFMKLVALLNEGHSEIRAIMPPANFRMFPLKIYFFQDGLYIVDAARKHKHCIGSRIIKIGNRDLDEVYSSFKFLIGAENNWFRKSRFSYLGLTAELLEAEGFIDDAEKVEFLLEGQDGKQYKLELKPQPALAWAYWAILKPIENESAPVNLNRRKSNYWFSYLEESKTVYFQFNEVQNQRSGESLAAFAQRLDAFANENDFDRFVIDLRSNGGGDNTLLEPLIEVLSENKKINRRGKMFTIISGNTYSAAINFASTLENRTKTLFVGEPTGSGPNLFGDPGIFTLPNSGLEVMLSSRYWQSSVSEDGRNKIEPDIPAVYLSQDYFAGRDPAMAAILAYEFKPPPTVALSESQMERYIGRYVFSPYQILSIQKIETGLSFRLTDFVPGSFAEIQSDIYPVSESLFLTDINHIKLAFNSDGEDEAKKLIFYWGETEKLLARAPDGFILPMELISLGRIDEGLQAIRKQKNTQTALPPNSEQHLNSQGYRYLAEDKAEQAIRIFKLNIDFFPESPNAYDSLADAYIAAGENEQAIACYQKVLELLKGNQNNNFSMQLVKNAQEGLKQLAGKK